MSASASPAPAAVMPGEAVIEGEEADSPDTEISALQPAGATALDDTSATAGQGSTEIKVEAVETPPVPNYDYPIGGAGYRRRPISEGSNCAECCCCCTTVGRFIICFEYVGGDGVRNLICMLVRLDPLLRWACGT